MRFDKIIWLENGDARGGKIGLTESSDEHPNCVDVIGDFANGYVVFIRIKRSEVGRLIEALTLFKEGSNEY